MQTLERQFGTQKNQVYSAGETWNPHFNLSTRDASGQAESEFGGRNKARRLKRLIAKGKTAKAQKLAEKIQGKIDKLADKGKIDKKRYKFLMEKMAQSGISSLTYEESEELEGYEDEALSDDPELKNELDQDDDGETGKILGMPKLVVWIGAPLLGAGILIGTLALFGVFKK